MASSKEIRGKIKSVKNTQKITRAMQMVATSKMRKTQEKMYNARPYANNIRRVMAHLALSNPATRSITPFLRKPDKISRAGIILITSDKGLCGGLNANIIKLFCDKLLTLQNQKIDVEICALGHKGFNAANRMKLNIISSAIGVGDVPHMEQIIGPVSAILQGFHNGTLDAVYVIYSHFINTMKQQATYEQLLPLTDRDLTLDNKLPWDYLYEPSEVEVLDELVKRYIESVVYQCLADNMASEQAARMVAMRAATDNAEDAIYQLQLSYNKTRQAAITKELSEIVAGSSAV